MPEIVWGSVVYTIHYHGPLAGTITIDQADPHALIMEEILIAAFEGTGAFQPFLRLEPPPPGSPIPDDACGCRRSYRPSYCFGGWLVHLDLPGRHLVYRVGNYRPLENVWEASWPD